MADRSATDILITIEENLATLAKRVQNIENLQKILLQKINTAPARQEPTDVKASASVEFNGVINKDNFENRPITSKFASIASMHGIDVEESRPKTTIQGQSMDSLPPDPSGEDMVEIPVRKKSRGQRGVKEDTSSKTSVSQILKREDGTAVFLANVEVIDFNGTLVNQGRTNANGRWLMALAPGDYQVHVMKRFPPDSGKESIDSVYEINVPSTDKPWELDPLTF